MNKNSASVVFAQRSTRHAHVLRLLTAGNPWVLEAVRVDGVDQIEIYDGLRLSFSADVFVTAGGSCIWPSSGAWCFNDIYARTLQRNDGVQVNIIELTEQQLMLSLDWSKSTVVLGRLSSVEGRHVFIFSRS